MPIILKIFALILTGSMAFSIGYKTGDHKQAEKSTINQSTANLEFDSLETKNIWVLPVITSKKNRKKSLALKNIINRELEWFEKASGGQEIFKVTQVLEEHKLTASPKQECPTLEKMAKTISKDLPPKTILLAVVENSIECKYGGLASMKGTWAIILGWNKKDNKIPASVLIHELGHVLGLPHAKRFDCPILTAEKSPNTPEENCGLIEYGDKTDPMGKPPRNILPNFNAIHLNELNWGSGKQTIDTPGVHKIFLFHPAKKNRVKTFMPDYYLIEDIAISYRGADPRDPTHLDNGLINKITTNYEGVYLHKITESDKNGLVETTLLPFTQLEIAGKKGFHYISPQKTFAIHVDETNINGAKITVIKGTDKNTIKDIWGPVIKISKKKRYSDPVYIGWNALDPSGISHYDVEYSGVRRLVEPNGEKALYIKRKKKPQTIVIKAYDFFGNETIETIIIEKRNKNNR